LTIAGGVLLGVLGRKWSFAVTGVLLAILGNADQALVLTFALFVATWAAPMKAWRIHAALCLALAASASILLTLWAASAGVNSRAGLLDDFWKQSLVQFFSALPVQIYAGLGISTIFLFLTILGNRWQSMIPIILGLVVPLIFSAITLDQTRVFIVCSSAVVSAVIVNWSGQMEVQFQRIHPHWLAAIFLTVLALPAIEITGNIIRVPWAVFVPYIQIWVFST